MKRFIPHSKPFVDKKEAEAVAKVVLSGQLAQGKEVEKLEQKWCALTKRKNAVAVGSGLAALRLSLLSLGVRKGDEVLVPAYSCVALFNAALSLGAKPVLVDVTPNRWTISVEDVKRKIRKKTKAIVAVHLFGMPAPVEELSRIGIPLIEDCAHGIGKLKSGHPLGSVGSLCVSSFYPTKMVAGGEGGIVAGDNKEKLAFIRKARNYGDQKPSPFFLNDKMTDIEAAITLCQLKKLPQMLKKRQVLARAYMRDLRSLEEDGLLVLPREGVGRVWYRFPVWLTQARAEAISLEMHKKGVMAEQPVWDYQAVYPLPKACKVTHSAFDQLLSLPLYPGLTANDQKRVVTVLSKAL